MRRGLVWILFVVAATSVPLAVRSFRRPSSEALAPRAIHLGEDECARCHMIVSDPHYAAERVLGPDDTKVYDDAGCCLEALARDRSGTVFFAEASTGEWVPVADARFERTPQPTPMGFGLAVARASQASRESLDLEGAIALVTSGTRPN
jgi:hypothetical protein